MAFGWLKKTGKVLLNTAPIAAAVAGALGVPYADRIGAVIRAANVEGVSGKDRMNTVVDLLMRDSTVIFAVIEKKFGKKVDPDLAAAYVKAITQAHYDLLKGMGEI